MSNEEHIRFASGAEEARAFLDRLQETEILVDRSSKLAVDYRFIKVQPAPTEQFWEGIRLWVFINPEPRRAEDAFINCSDQGGRTNFIGVKLIEYLEQYVQSQNCP